MQASDPYSSGVLIPEAHHRLVDDLPRIAGDAGIQREWLWQPLSAVATAAEQSWARRYKHHRSEGVSGLVLYGDGSEVVAHMSALAGCLLRNFIDAKLMTLQAVLDAVDERHFPSASCLLIPNLFLGKAQGAPLAAWLVTRLHDLLLERQMRGMQTVAYVSDMSALSAEYGVAIYGLLKNNYLHAKI